MFMKHPRRIQNNTGPQLFPETRQFLPDVFSICQGGSGAGQAFTFTPVIGSMNMGENGAEILCVRPGRGRCRGGTETEGTAIRHPLDNAVHKSGISSVGRQRQSRRPGPVIPFHSVVGYCAKMTSSAITSQFKTFMTCSIIPRL